MVLLLTAGGMLNSAWAAKVTYHILTLPIDSTSRYNYHMRPTVHGHRLEAIQVVVDNQNTVELPAHYKSPLAENFTYYTSAGITASAKAEKLFNHSKNPNKGYLYDVKGDAVAVAEGTAITGSTAVYYVTYTYNESNTIAKLDGSENYNIEIRNKGFLALNRGRNNRPAVIPKMNGDKVQVTPEMLAREDFSYIESPHKDITTYWQSGDNKNNKEDVAAQWFFVFRLEGMDPYNIIVRTTYDKDTTYIEKNEGTSNFVYKWYKEAALFSVGTANCYIASDEHRLYTTAYAPGSANPTNPAYTVSHGNWHGQTGAIWSTVALLNNTSNNGYVLMGTRTVDNNGVVPTPSGGKYNYLKFTYNNLNFNQISATEATNNNTIERFYPVEKVTFKIATSFYATDKTSAHIISASDEVSQYTVEHDPIEDKYLPKVLQRKFCNFTGKFYSDADCTNEITYFNQATKDPTEGYQVYVGYETTSTIPFTPITPVASYDSTVWNKATWYELTDENSTEEYGRKIKWDGSSAYKNNGAAGEHEKTSEFAFVGDPYELKVLYRQGTIGAPTTGSFVTLSSHAIWDIPEDNETDRYFRLRKYNDTGYWNWDAGQTTLSDVAYGGSSSSSVGKEAQTVTFTVTGLNGSKYYKITTSGAGAGQIVSVSPAVGSVAKETGTSATITVKLAANDPEGSEQEMILTIQQYDDEEGKTESDAPPATVTITQGTASSAFAGNPVGYHATDYTRVKVLELPKLNFVYNIIDQAGNLAIKANATQTIFSHIAGYASIPDSVRSPFLADETISYWDTYTAGECSGKIVETSNTNNDNIYVTYTVANLSKKSIRLSADQRFKVKLNDEHIYYSTASSKILSKPEVLSTDTFSWILEGGDPYAMKIRNVGNDNKYVQVYGETWANNAALVFVASIDDGSRFIAMMSIYTGVYEVLAASGTTDYYHIGRPSDTGAETKIYSTSTYAHGTDPLRFELAGEDAIVYHLIDRSNKEILHVSSYNPRLTLPAEYVSPLVGEYHYYPTRAKATTNLAGDRITEPDEDTNEDGSKTAGKGDNQIYVTYDANDVVTFNTGQYMLRFLEPHAYHLEDGNDKLTSGTIDAMYPYCNGDGNLNIYGNDMQKEQFGGGASTRPRWVWYFDSELSDPYHVRIRSKSTINYNSISNPTYLTTYAVHFTQDTTGEYATKNRIITGGTLPGVASTSPTEYMILGTPGNYRLMTTDSISDGVTKVRRKVTSLEQYWKTYNMLKLCVLGISKNTDAYSEEASTWVVPADQRTPLNTRLEALGVGTGNWHSYEVYANATRWNGYNDKSNGHEKKVVEKLEHWFQTFDMGTGTFDIESADIPPVLVLLDLHGWEIMRRPLPTTTYPVGEELADLRVYDSPLVEKYYFYSNATKATGCHKYSLRMQNGAERDQVKVNGVRYSSTSLGDLPPKTATGVVSGGAIQDLYVIYDVKEEYVNNCAYSLDTTTSPLYKDTVISQPYLVIQNGRFYKTENKSKDDKSYFSKPIFEHTDPEGGNIYDLIVSPHNHGGTNANIIDGSGNFYGNNFWYIKPNINIDQEMGIDWIKVTGETTENAAKNKLKKEYMNKSGFDPYNLQIQLLNKDDGTPDGRYLTAHMTSTTLDNGIMVGSYTGSGGKTLMTLENACTSPLSAEGYDHTTMHVTNQTFMAVSDVNGNMQIMPRFDHTLRLDLNKVNPWDSELLPPEDHAKARIEDNNSMGSQTTFFVCPKRFHYHIIDNYGREALRYKRGADFYPAITYHFKSPVAKNFTYYTGLAVSETPEASSVGEWGPAKGQYKRIINQPKDSINSWLPYAVKLLPDTGTYYYRVGTRGDFVYKKVKVTKGLNEQQIKGSFAEAKLEGIDCDVYVRYEYDLDADLDADRILQGEWYSVQLDSKDLVANGTINTADGTGVSLLQGTSRPGTIDAKAKQWQWKFFVAPADTTSDYYVQPDPYAVHLFNRRANYTTDPSAQPSPMAVAIQVPDGATGYNDRFALLTHPNGGYALVVAKTYSDYNYPFLNGGDMTTEVAAKTANEAKFNYKSDTISDDAQLVLNDDVIHNFTYFVFTNDSALAITGTQTNEEADGHQFAPYLPDTIQSPLLNLEDYKYYGFASRPGGVKYAVIPQTILSTLSGLYDDSVYVRYNAYDMDKTSFKVPNKKTLVDSHIARDPNSVDVAMNIKGGLPYNIVWYNDNTMKSTDNTNVTSEANHDGLSGNEAFVWYFTGNDPYALKIKHKNGKYLDGDASMATDSTGAMRFMLLRKTGYDYGILQQTGSNIRLTGYGQTTTAADPTHYVIFGLSVHDLIYHLIIANTGSYVDIPYREKAGDSQTTKRIPGTTQRDLTSVNDSGTKHVAGEKYQLGDTVAWGNPAVTRTYCKDIGAVSIGDELEVPNEFYRPNCTFEFYIEGIYQHYSTKNENEGKTHATLHPIYEGLKLKDNRLMSDDRLIDQNVVVNIVYAFDTTVATNTGADFVKRTDENLWYTFETQDGETPYLAHYTNAWGLQAMEGRETRYTNDYLWTPLGDVYGFKMYNRYMLKNSEEGDKKVMTMSAISEGQNLLLAKPGTDGYIAGNEIFELVGGDVAGYFRVHPVVNTGATKYYVRRDPSDNYTKLSTTPCDWRYGLDMNLLEPYYERAGYVGGLTDVGKAAYEDALTNGKIADIQDIVYDDAYIVHYTPGYYRMHNQPGVSGIDPVRYASGYLHQLEKDVNGDGKEADAIRMHFYSEAGTRHTFAGAEDGLDNGFTETHATWGEIPIDSTEIDPSTIFYMPGGIDKTDPKDTLNPRVTIQTQGLYVKGVATDDDHGDAVMTDTAARATTFSLMDIGGAVLLIHDGSAPATRQYLNFSQDYVVSGDNKIYDLKYFHNSPTDDAKWCLQPVQKTATPGNGEMPFKITTNNGGDGYYYATFYAPFDVLLPADDGGKTYNAYTCSKWYYDGVHPTPVPAVSTYAEGKFVPAGTPVIIRVKDESGELTLTLPSSAPSTSLTCIFSGQYLEQLLAVDAAHDVYTMGVPFISHVEKDGDYNTTGDITAPLTELASSGVGFYINATANKEDDPLRSLWRRNNRYVLHNKIYYRATGAPGAPDSKRGTEYVPVIFGDEPMPEQPSNSSGYTGDGIYDLLGRRMASMPDAPGIYIVNGEKVVIGK